MGNGQSFKLDASCAKYKTFIKWCYYARYYSRLEGRVTYIYFCKITCLTAKPSAVFKETK
jgi:hypothetical protein